MLTTENDGPTILSQEGKDLLYKDLLDLNDRISKLHIFPAIGWIYTFDIIKDIFDNNQYADLAVNDYVDECVPEGITLKQIFDKYYDDIDELGINMDLGNEVLEEVIRDWMRENDFLVALDDDGWLDD